MELRQAFAKQIEGFVGAVRKTVKVPVFRRDGAKLDQRVDIQDLLPVLLTAIDHHQDFFCELLRLHQGQDLEEFVQSAEATGKDHQRLREISEPVLAHEEVMELKIQLGRDPPIRKLLVGQANVEPDGFAAR